MPAVHPIIQFMAILLALYVFCLGLQRFRFLHLDHKVVFRWKRHVVLGEVTLGVLLASMVGGMAVVYVYRHGVFVTGIHGEVALVMVPLMIFGLVSGVYMNRRKRHRRVLPLVHGLNNLGILLMAASQIVSGLGIYRGFVLG